MIMVNAMTANTATNITASLGGVPATVIPGTDSGTTTSARTMIFQVINPPSGSQSATVSWTGSMNADVGVITVSGTDPTTPTSNGTFAASKSSPSATTSVTITSNPGDLTASIGYTSDVWVSPFTNQTLKWGLDSGVVGGDIGHGTGTATHTWTDQYAGQLHSVSGANFRAAGTPNYSLSVSPASQTVIQGNPTSYNLTITPVNGFTGQVTFSVSGLPSGANGTFSPNPATSTSALSVTTSTTTPAGSYPLTVTGVSGSLTHTVAATLVVTAPDFSLGTSPSSQTVIQGNPTSYNLTITPVNGFTGQSHVQRERTALRCQWHLRVPIRRPHHLCPLGDHEHHHAGWIVSLDRYRSQRQPLMHTVAATLVVTAPDFSLGTSPSSQTVIQGNPTSYNLTITPVNGFTGQVTFSVSGLPSGANGTFSPNPATSTSALSVTTSTTTPAGSYPLTVTGVSGSLTHTVAATLVVTAAPNFTLSGSPSSQTVVPGGSTTYSVTIAPTNGFTGQVTFSVGGLPTGATGSFSPNPATSISTLSVPTSVSTPIGTYPLTVTGTSGTLTHTATVTLVVNTTGQTAVVYDNKGKFRISVGRIQGNHACIRYR